MIFSNIGRYNGPFNPFWYAREALQQMQRALSMWHYDIVALPCYRETISYENGEYWIRFEVKAGPYDPWREWIPPFEEDAPLPVFNIEWVRYLDDPPRS